MTTARRMRTGLTTARSEDGEPHGRCHDRPSQQQTRAVEQKWLEDWVPDLDHAEDEWSEDDTRSQGEKRLADGQLPHAPADQRETT